MFLSVQNVTYTFIDASDCTSLHCYCVSYFDMHNTHVRLLSKRMLLDLKTFLSLQLTLSCQCPSLRTICIDVLLRISLVYICKYSLFGPRLEKYILIKLIVLKHRSWRLRTSVFGLNFYSSVNFFSFKILLLENLNSSLLPKKEQCSPS